MGRMAGDRWAQMNAREREPYERLSTASKAEYARMKMLTPAQRIVAAGAAGVAATQPQVRAPLHDCLCRHPWLDWHMHILQAL
jgi:hypothetical protein